MTPVAAENTISTAAGGEPTTTSEIASISPVAAEHPVSAAAGGEPTAISTGPVQVRAAAPGTVFEVHFLELSSRASLPVAAAAYAGLRGFTISAEHLLVQRTDTFPIHWAAEVKGGNVFWLHFDGTLPEMQDKAYFKGFGKWARWQQRRGCFGAWRCRDVHPGCRIPLFSAWRFYPEYTAVGEERWSFSPTPPGYKVAIL